jgi:hypothetical protein
MRVAFGGGDTDATPLPIGLWARFNVGETSTFQLLDDNENVVGSGVPGGAGVIETSAAKLYLANSGFQGSGPTGPSVTVNFAVSFTPAAARGNAAQPYQSQLLASDVLQGVQARISSATGRSGLNHSRRWRSTGIGRGTRESQRYLCSPRPRPRSPESPLGSAADGRIATIPRGQYYDPQRNQPTRSAGTIDRGAPRREA